MKVDFLDFLTYVVDRFEYIKKKKCYCAKFNGQFIDMGNSRGRFTTLSGLKNALRRLVRLRMLYYIYDAKKIKVDPQDRDEAIEEMLKYLIDTKTIQIVEVEYE